jgi:hypothetical protein
MLKRLWTHDLIKKIGGTYNYYLSELGRTAITMGLKLKELVLIPELARALAWAPAPLTRRPQLLSPS